MGPGSTGPVRFTDPRHLHKGLSGAYKASLTAVPVCIGECRSVRVTGVLDASRNLLVLALCWLLHPLRLQVGERVGDRGRAA